jgi:hypothetical protein
MREDALIGVNCEIFELERKMSDKANPLAGLLRSKASLQEKDRCLHRRDFFRGD